MVIEKIFFCCHLSLGFFSRLTPLASNYIWWSLSSWKKIWVSNIRVHKNPSLAGGLWIMLLKIHHFALQCFSNSFLDKHWNSLLWSMRTSCTILPYNAVLRSKTLQVKVLLSWPVGLCDKLYLHTHRRAQRDTGRTIPAQIIPQQTYPGPP